MVQRQTATWRTGIPPLRNRQISSLPVVFEILKSSAALPYSVTQFEGLTVPRSHVHVI
jgi:hypothetical protein